MTPNPIPRADVVSPDRHDAHVQARRAWVREWLRERTTVVATEHEGTPAWLILDDTRARGQTMTDSLVVARADLDRLRDRPGWRPARADGARAWTDDYSSLVQVLDVG